MINDVRLALRSLMRQPGFTLLAILTLSIGIGATAAIFSVVDHVVLRPMPFPNGDRMTFVWMKSPPTTGQFMVTPSLALARELEANARSFDALEIYDGESRVMPGPEGGETIPVLAARPSLFTLLEGRVRIGRTLLADDMEPNAPNVIVLSHKLWTERFGRDPEILSKDVRLEDSVYRVIGVMNPGFRVPQGSHDAWVPLRADPRQPDSSRRVTMLAVLKRGVTTAAASDELVRLAGDRKGADAMLERGFTPSAVEPSTFTSSTLHRSTLVLFGAVGLLLLIGCANVAALLVTRNAGRTREVAIRRALGATRGRLVRLLLIEALLLSTAAGIGAIVVALWTMELVLAVMPERLLSSDALQLDGMVLAFTGALSILTAIIFGLLPAVQGSNVALTDAMRGDARSGSTTRSRHLTRRILTSAEIALAVILLVGSGLLIRSFVQLQRVPLGFDPSGTASVSVDLPETRYADAASQARFFSSLVEAARGLPGVTAVAQATVLPPSGGLMFGTMQVRGRPSDAPAGPGTVTGSTVSDEYFGLMRIPLREGRLFGPQDSQGSERVALVNEKLAALLWPGQSAVGQQFSFGGAKASWTTVVGVVGNVKGSGLRDGGHGDYQLYYTLRQSSPEFGSVVVRTSGDPARLLPMLRARVAELDPMLPVRNLMTGSDRIARELADERFNVLLLGLFSGMGLLLAAIGVYGMMALYVAHRQYEIGVRLALGATPRAVMRLVLGHAVTIAVAGVGVGVCGALLLTRLMTKLLYEVRPTDPVTFAVVIAIVAVVAFVASVVPMRRALRVDPAAALRMD